MTRKQWVIVCSACGAELEITHKLTARADGKAAGWRFTRTQGWICPNHTR